MSIASLASSYLALNVALALGCLMMLALERLEHRIGPRQLLRLHYTLAALALAALVVQSVLPRSAFFEPPVKLWSAQSLETFAADYDLGAAGTFVNFGTDAPRAHDATTLTHGALAVLLVVLGAGALKLARDLRLLRDFRRNSQCARRRGRVRLWICDQPVAPFSFRLFREAHVVVPAFLLPQRTAFQVSIAHELQHHRQGDTLWLHLFWLLRLVCFANPFVYLWSVRLAQTQELACDEAVIARRRWSIEEYGNALLDVARATGDASRPCFATGLIGRTGRTALQRRIERMLRPRARSLRRPTVVALAFGLFGLLTAGAYAAGDSVQDRRLTLAQAQQMADRVRGGGFVVTVNDHVLRELNRYAGTLQGRVFVRDSLSRMNAYRGVVASVLGQYELPEALLAVPLVESGYQNLEPDDNRLRAAGLWQFIPSTARAYGLRVESRVDERLDPAMLTDAAARMLQAQRLRFNDWNLALMAYNMGAGNVQSAIEKAASRDPWALVRAGYEGDPGYLAKVHAAAILIANPEAVE